VQGRHGNIGYDAPKEMDENQQAKLRIGSGADPRISTAQMQVYTWEQANTNTTRTLVDASLRLVDELPEGTPGDQVLNVGTREGWADTEDIRNNWAVGQTWEPAMDESERSRLYAEWNKAVERTYNWSE